MCKLCPSPLTHTVDLNCEKIVTRRVRLTFERKVRAGYADAMRVVLHDGGRLGHDPPGRVHRPDPEVALHATGHQVPGVRTE